MSFRQRSAPVVAAAVSGTALIAGSFAAAASPSAVAGDGVATSGVVQAAKTGGGARAYASVPARTLPVVRSASGGGISEVPPNHAGTESPPKGAAERLDRAAAPRAPAPAPAFTFEGISTASAGAGGVPDSNGDVGTDHYVEMVNRLWAVYSKTGQLLGGPFAENALWQGAAIPDTPCKSSDRGDPIVLYDELANRWLLSFFAFTGSPPAAPFYECIAVSQTSNPLGTWWIYSFNFSAVAAIGNSFPDYPKFGVWPDAYYMSANLFPASGQDALFVAFNRQAMINGQDASNFLYYIDPNLSGNVLPADMDGDPPPAGSPGYFLVPHPTEYRLLLYRFAVKSWTTPEGSISTAEIPVAAYDYEVCDDNINGTIKSQCVHQPGTTVKLDPIDHDQLMFRLAYRNFGTHESLVASQTIDVIGDQTRVAGVAGIRWYEIRSPRTTPALYQQGTFAPDVTTHRWLPAIAIDKFGTIALGYNVSNAVNVFPGIRYAARAASDPLGQLPLSETTLVAGGGSKTQANPDGRARWGDYSSMSVDPVDDCTFWFTGEYLPRNVGATEWNTRIGVFSIPPCVGPSPQPPAPQPPTPQPPAPQPTPPAPPTLRRVSMSLGGPRAAFQRERTFQVSWRAVANGARYDVQYRGAKFRGIYGSWVSWKSNTPVTSTSFTGRAGTSYCFRVRANPRSGFTSDWATPRCTALPVSVLDRTMRGRGGWRYYRARGRFLNAFALSVRRGASLGLTGVRATRLALVVTKCPRCGSVNVYWNKRLLASARLTAASLLYKQIIEVGSFPTQRKGTIRIVVTSRRKPVPIEGLGIFS